MKIHSAKLVLPLLIASAPAFAQSDETEYKPQTETIVYRPIVPPAIARTAGTGTMRKFGPTRFYGTFRRGTDAFAVHLWDFSPAKSQFGSPNRWSRFSQVDVFQFVGGKWQKAQSSAFARATANSKDALQIQAESLWLDPASQTLPLVHLHIGEKTKPSAIGLRTDVYAVLKQPLNFRAFLAFDGDVPYSDSTVTKTDISFPDAQGNLTLLHNVSDPGTTSYGAYSWGGQSQPQATWQKVGSIKFENGYETASWWNGKRFVPYAENTIN